MLRVDLTPGSDECGREPAPRRRLLSWIRPGGLSDGLWGRWWIVLGGTALALTLLVAFTSFERTRRARRIDAALPAAVQDSVRLAGTVDREERLASDRSRELGQLSPVARDDRDRYAWSRVLHALSVALPDAARLIRVERVRPLPALAVRVEGVASEPTVVTGYARELELLPWIRTVRLQETRRLSNAAAGSGGGSRAGNASSAGMSFVLTLEYLPTGPGADGAAVGP